MKNVTIVLMIVFFSAVSESHENDAKEVCERTVNSAQAVLFQQKQSKSRSDDHYYKLINGMTDDQRLRMFLKEDLLPRVMSNESSNQYSSLLVIKCINKLGGTGKYIEESYYGNRR